jgi:hypothetical protein
VPSEGEVGSCYSDDNNNHINNKKRKKREENVHFLHSTIFLCFQQGLKHMI